MQRRRRLRAACLFLLATAVLGPSAAGAAGQEQTDLDWPQFQGGSGHGGFLPDGVQPPYRVRWTLLPPEGEALSAAIVVDEQAISVGSQAVYGIDLSTGEVAWSIPRAGGPLSAPAVASLGGRDVLVYLEGPMPAASPTTPTVTPTPAAPTASPGTGDDLDLERVTSVVGVDLADRSELWRTPLEAASHSGVTIDDGTVYVGDRRGNVYAVSLDDGSFLWPSPAGSSGQVDAPVAVASGNVYVVRRDLNTGLATLMALDAASGERVWPGPADDAAPTGGSAPVAIDGSVVVGSTDPVVLAFDAPDGELRWSALTTSRFSPFTSPAFAAGDVVVAGLSGGLYRLDPSEGERVWSYQFNEVVLQSSPVVSGSTVLLGLDDGRLVAVDIDRGRLIWQSEPSTGALGAIALSSDTIVAVKAGEQAGLIAYERDPSGSLFDEPSPTELDAGTTFGRYSMAAAIVFVLAFVPGLVLARRAGPAQLEPSTVDEPSDPDARRDGDEESERSDDR